MDGNVIATGLADAIIERFTGVAPVMVGFDPSVSFGAGERLVNDNEHSLILASAQPLKHGHSQAREGERVDPGPLGRVRSRVRESLVLAGVRANLLAGTSKEVTGPAGGHAQYFIG